MKGTFDNQGMTLTGNMANTICQALKTGTKTTVVFNGRPWNVDMCGGVELTADGTICSCSSPGYALRPCAAMEWGGVNSATCAAPTQTISVVIQ